MKERRFELKIPTNAQGHEVRAYDARMDTEDGKLRGYAVVFDVLSEEMWGFRERVRRGAFTAHLAEGADVRALWQHDVNYVLGRTKSKTLELVEDIHGLRSVIDPPDTQWARDAITTIKRGDVDQMSFAFKVVTDEWNVEDEVLIRTIVDAKLYDVSPVTFPAYPQTSISARADQVQVRSVTVPITGDDGGSARLAILRRRLELAEVEI
jgi:HK97 family phage prohead protease